MSLKGSQIEQLYFSGRTDRIPIKSHTKGRYTFVTGNNLNLIANKPRTNTGRIKHRHKHLWPTFDAIKFPFRTGNRKHRLQHNMACCTSFLFERGSTNTTRCIFTAWNVSWIFVQFYHVYCFKFVVSSHVRSIPRHMVSCSFNFIVVVRTRHNNNIIRIKAKE